MKQASRKLAVVVKGWPRLSETFIAQELVALEAVGHRFDIWSLRHPTDTQTHPLHQQIMANVHYLPEYLHQEPWRVAKAVFTARYLPGFATAYSIWKKDYARDRSRNRIRRFGQACVLATEMSPDPSSFYSHFLHTPSSVARYAAIMRDDPWGFSAHAKDIWTSPEWELREKLSSASAGAAFGATCTAYGAKHLRALSEDPQRINLVYHGLDLSRFPAPPTRRLRDPKGPVSILSVGRLVEKKGFDRLISALALLPRDLDWHWVHIGGGGLKDTFAERAAKLGIESRITWRGACDQPQVIEAMRSSDMFVLPSRVATDGDRDGLPNVLMEAASQTLPIISTSVAAIPEFIDSGVHGILTNDAPEELADAIIKVVRDPQNAAKMAQAAYDRLVADFEMHPGIAKLSRRLTDMGATIAT